MRIYVFSLVFVGVKAFLGGIKIENRGGNYKKGSIACIRRGQRGVALDRRRSYASKVPYRGVFLGHRRFFSACVVWHDSLFRFRAVDVVLGHKSDVT